VSAKTETIVMASLKNMGGKKRTGPEKANKRGVFRCGSTGGETGGGGRELKTPS